MKVRAIYDKIVHVCVCVHSAFELVVKVSFQTG